MPNILVNGIVAARDLMPYLVMDVDGHQVQMTLADARNIARDIEVACARIEADAMILKFFRSQKFPAGAGAALMVEFRDFRAGIDDEPVERTRIPPED